jgi:hypothetical protein
MLPSAFRTPATSLSDFLRSLAVPRVFYESSESSRREQEWEILRARQGGTKRLDFFDHNLVGPEGAVAVLRAIEKSPGVTDVSLYVSLSLVTSPFLTFWSTERTTT